MKTLGHIALLLTVLSSGALFACDLEGIWGEGVVNACTKDRDCGTHTCNADGICVADVVAPVEIGLEVAALAFSAPTVAQLPSEEIIANNDADVTLPGVTTLFGRVRIGTASFVPARVTVTGPEVIRGVQPYIAETLTGVGTTASDGEVADYTVTYARGQTVRVRVEPTGVPSIAPTDLQAYQGDVVLPPLEREVTLTGATMRVDFAYLTDIFDPCGARDDQCAFSVAVVPESGAPEGANLDDLGVVAVTEDGTVVSSYGRVVNGLVSLRLARRVVPQGQPPAPLFLRIGSSMPRADFVSAQEDFPTFRVGPIDVRTLTTVTLPVQAYVNVNGRVENSSAQPVGAASVRFVAKSLANGYSGRFAFERVNASAPVNGTFVVRLFPGEYDVIVTPATPLLGGILRTTLTVNAPLVGNTSSGHVFVIPESRHLSGTLTTFLGDVANLVEIRAVPFPDSLAQFTTTRTDADGNFMLAVDAEAPFDLLASPFTDSGFASQIIPHTATDGALSFALDAPVVRSGVVRDESGAPLPFARVNAYRVLRTPTVRALLVATVTADGDGRFAIQLAP